MAKTNIVILTGAGISAESGLQTFRAEDGLWNNYAVEEVATPEAFFEDPELVQSFYNMRRKELQATSPNAAHKALYILEQNWEGNFLLITQNIDDLHERAGSQSPLHMHGELLKARCANTETVYDWHDDINESSRCECCNEFGTLRPHIVWFGEMPLKMEHIASALQNCDIFLSIGTSGNVYPAAGFVQEAIESGCSYTAEVNLEETEGAEIFDEGIYGLATEELPKLVERLLKGQLS